MNLLHLFDLSLVNRRDEPALEWAGESFTFGEIERRSNRTANALRARGFVRGDRLCVHLANRIELIDLFLACVKLGVIFVPINVLYREREIAHIVGDAEPRATITEATRGTKIITVISRLMRAMMTTAITAAIHLPTWSGIQVGKSVTSPISS